MSTRGDGQSRMLETCSLEQAHAPLPADRLDMRACHPASKIGDRVLAKRGFHAPLPGFYGKWEQVSVTADDKQPSEAVPTCIDLT